MLLLRCDDDDVRLRAGDFVALFFVDVFLAVGFLADDARACDFAFTLRGMAIAEPAELPAKMPSSRAMRRVIRAASRSVTFSK